MHVDSLVQRLQQIEFDSNRSVIIGIEGFGGSGKTTLSQRIADALGDSYIIHIDDFIVKSKLKEPAWDTGVFDHDRLANQVLKPAASSQQVRYQKLLYNEDRLGDYILVPSVKYLIVEGISCYIPQLAEYYDYKIWIDTTISTSKTRGQNRTGTHGSPEDWAAWAEIDLAYLQKYHPELAADFTISNK